MKRQILIFMIAMLVLLNRDASAFWGSDSNESASGLNVTEGFDVNTIKTLSGTVITPPDSKGQDQHTVMTVATTQGTVTVVLGPRWYWNKQNITIAKDQNLVITGSLAQGKDGALYLFVQRLENQSSGESVTLRSESGTALWSRTGSGSRSGTGQFNGSGTRSGAGNRGGSGIRGGRR